MNVGKSRNVFAAIRRFVTFRLLFEMVLVTTILVGGIWIAKRPPRVEPKPPVLMDIPLTDEHIVMVKNPRGGSHDSRFLFLTLREGTVVDRLGHDMRLTDPRLEKPIMFDLGREEVLYVTLQIDDAETTSASDLAYALRCISAAVPVGKKCYIEVLLTR